MTKKKPLVLKIKMVFYLFLIGVSSNSFAQPHTNYNTLVIPTALKKNANAIVRLSDVTVNIQANNKMSVTVKRVVTVLNKNGGKHINAYVYYEDGEKIEKLQALVFDQFGNKIAKIRKKDFKDVSAVSGGTLYSDSRLKYLEYTPITYPYTVELTYQKNTGNTAFIPYFYPLNAYYLSVEKAKYSLLNPTQIPIRFKEANFKDLEVKTNNSPFNFYYEFSNLDAIKPENSSPLLSELVPKVMFAATNFTLEGATAKVENWNDFGKWMYNDLISDTQNLPQRTVLEIKDLVKDETTDVGKAKKIYEYVQAKTRYISVQVGIGGWKPSNAAEVDNLGYGDCKGLTNYTMALLKAANVAANYTVVYSGKSQKNIDKNFASVQGNHVILNIPQKDKTDIWLECTSQKTPFGYIGDFTDNRDVLVISPQGGKIKRTKKYTTSQNTQQITGKAVILKNGSTNISLQMISKGLQYDNRYWLDSETKRNLDRHYKSHWDYINDLTINKIDITNNKESVVFKEAINFTANNYANKVGDRMLVVLNSFNRNTFVPKKYRDRQLPLILKRGFKDTDEVEIQLPLNYKIEALPNSKTITNKFGSYTLEITKKDANILVYKRQFVINEGVFNKEEYAAYRDFYKQVAKLDNSKLVLIKNN
ncbi:MAG: DUF3857 domain-containing protein [Winogradskyella sp.]